VQLNSEVKKNLTYFECSTLAVKILTVFTLLTGCSGSVPRAPVVDLQQPPPLKISHHTVASGETLYSIAWRYNMEFKDLARVNGLAEPYVIQPGQHLSLNLKDVPLAPNNQTRGSDSVDIRSRSQPSPAPDHTPIPTQNAQLIWRWPASGTLLAKFSGARPRPG